MLCYAEKRALHQRVRHVAAHVSADQLCSYAVHKSRQSPATHSREQEHHVGSVCGSYLDQLVLGTVSLTYAHDSPLPSHAQQVAQHQGVYQQPRKPRDDEHVRLHVPI